METVDQQTDTLVNSPKTFRTRLWQVLQKIIVVLMFLGLAVSFAFIFTAHEKIDQNRSKYALSSLQRVHYFKRINTMQIINGSNLKTASIKKFPYMGALISKYPNILLCTVVILNVQFVLTGANCFVPQFSDLRVIVGDDFWNNANEYLVKEFIINSKYNEKSLENNLAIIKVKPHIVLGKTIQVAELPRKRFVQGMNGQILGWSLWHTTERNNIKLLQQDLKIWKFSECKRYIGDYSSNRLICASLNSSVCHLDLTGPLVVGNKVVGFWSWGLSCISDPSVFTNLFYFRKWIFTKSSIIS